MLFIGHFSFDEIDNDDRQRHGYLTCLVDAENPDDAVSQFEGHIKKMKTKFVCILMNEQHISDSVKTIQQEYDRIVAEWDNG